MKKNHLQIFVFSIFLFFVIIGKLQLLKLFSAFTIIRLKAIAAHLVDYTVATLQPLRGENTCVTTKIFACFVEYFVSLELLQ